MINVNKKFNMKNFKILFVCHGNICRSVAAEYILKSLYEEADLSFMLSIDSAAATNDEIGNSIYPAMRKVLEKYEIEIGNHRARRITSKDLDEFDMIFIMDDENYEDLKYLFRDNKNLNKVHYLTEYSSDNNKKEIDDPWYTRDFEKAFLDIKNCCENLLAKLKEQ